MRDQRFILELITAISIFFILLPAGIHAEDKVPVAVFPTDTYNFGIAYEGNTVTHEFAVKNTGNADLEIYEVKSG